MNDPVGLVFMRYAFPCAEIAEQLGNLSQEEVAAMEAALVEGESLPRTRLEKFFPAATRRLKEVAAKEGLKDYWTLEAIHLHYLKHHARYIDEGDGLLKEMMPCEKELCKCSVGRILRISRKGNSITNSEEPIFDVETKKGTIRVLGRYLSKAKEGDFVAVHRRFATEVLDLATAERFS
jgi:hypothetical protein